MLADESGNVQVGGLDENVHLPFTAKMELVEFIAQELPLWRDHADRPQKSAETILTEHLCDHLNSATCYSAVWSHIQFRTETSDDTVAGRQIDLTVKPRGIVLHIEGRRHSQFDALFPIECKRLPTPKGNYRDHREYVVTDSGTTGGIQRFKFGYHGAAHNFAAMIAYIQKQTASYWLGQVNGWIHDLSANSNSVWSDSDILHILNDDLNIRLCKLKSHHLRTNNLGTCELNHLWIQMS